MKRTAIENLDLPVNEQIGRVWLDGNEITNRCISVDTDAGEAQCYIMMPDGWFKQKENGDLDVEVLKGKITFELKTQEAA